MFYTQKPRKDTGLDISTSNVARDVKVDANKFALKKTHTHSRDTILQ